MVKNRVKLTNKTCLNIPRIAYLFVLVLILTAIPLVSAFEFDNIKGDLIKNKDTSEYGKIEIRNSLFGWEWFQLDKVMSLELKENSEMCLDTGCSANTEIIMYEDGKLIDEVRFIDLKTGKETSIESYDIYVNGDLYNYEKVSGYSEGVKYNIELKGKVHPFQTVDWQIKSANTDWIDNWATWNSSIENGSVAFWPFEDGIDYAVEDVIGGFNMNSNSSNWTDGIEGGGLSFVPQTTTNYADNESVMQKNQTDFTISLWFRLNDDYDVAKSAYESIFKGVEHSQNNRLNGYFDPTSGSITLSYEGENQGSVYLSTTTTSWIAGEWYHLVLRWAYSQSNITLSVNGSADNSTAYAYRYNITGLDPQNRGKNFTVGACAGYTSFNGSIDNVGIWDRALSDSEVSALWNSGNAISPGGALAVTLNSPADNSDTFMNVTFNCTATVRGGNNITNISLYHNASGSWDLNQTNSTTRKSNSTSTFNALFDFGSYSWNCYACGNNSECVWGLTNNTFNVKRLVVNSETYNTNTIEGSSETFIINVTTNELFINTATLTYNNTEYIGTLTNGGYEYLISTTLSVDQITTSANLTFNWTFLMGDSSVIYSDSHNQSVITLTIDNCTTNTVTILNYTLKDEDNQTKLGGSGFNTEISVDVSIYTLGTTIEIVNFSNTFSEINPAAVCLSNNLGDTKFRMDVSTVYSSKNRETEHHYLQNYTLTNTTTFQNISLYNLNSSRSTAFLITYKDTNFLPVENALINIQREYVGDGLFRSVEIGKTDADGQTIGHLVKDDVVYTLIVSKNGRVLATFDNVVAWCEDIIAENCKINLNQFDTGIPPEDWETYQNLDYTLSFNEDTRIVSLVFNTIDGSSAVVTLNTTKSDRWMNETVCSDIVESSSGTLTCTIAASYGNVSVISRVYMNDELITQANFKIFPDRDDYFGGTSVIFLLILVIILPLMFITDTRLVVLGTIFGIVIAGALMIYTGFSWLGVGSSIIWIFIAGAIIIWKISERSKT